MEMNSFDYRVEAVADGGYFAYCAGNLPCCAYGETSEDACERLEQVVADYMSDFCMVEEYS